MKKSCDTSDLSSDDTRKRQIIPTLRYCTQESTTSSLSSSAFARPHKKSSTNSCLPPLPVNENFPPHVLNASVSVTSLSPTPSLSSTSTPLDPPLSKPKKISDHILQELTSLRQENKDMRKELATFKNLLLEIRKCVTTSTNVGNSNSEFLFERIVASNEFDTLINNLKDKTYEDNFVSWLSLSADRRSLRKTVQNMLQKLFSPEFVLSNINMSGLRDKTSFKDSLLHFFSSKWPNISKVY